MKPGVIDEVKRKIRSFGMIKVQLGLDAHFGSHEKKKQGENKTRPLFQAEG